MSNELTTKGKKKKKSENLEPYLLYEKSPYKDIPYMQGHCFDKILFTSCNKVIKNGQKKSFDFDSLYKPPKEISYEYFSDRIEDLVKKNNQLPKKQQKEFRTLMRLATNPYYNLGFIYSIIAYLMKLPIPILVKNLLEWISDPSADSKEGYYYGLGLSLVSFLSTFFEIFLLYYVCMSFDGCKLAGKVS